MEKMVICDVINISFSFMEKFLDVATYIYIDNCNIYIYVYK